MCFHHTLGHCRRAETTFYTLGTRLWFLGDVHEHVHAKKKAKFSRFVFHSPQFIFSNRAAAFGQNEGAASAGQMLRWHTRGPRASPWPSSLLTQLCWCNHSVTVAAIITAVLPFPAPTIQRLLHLHQQLERWNGFCMSLTGNEKISCQAAFHRHRCRRLITKEIKKITRFSFPACYWNVGK